jgi:hypothetical protein
MYEAGEGLDGDTMYEQQGIDKCEFCETITSDNNTYVAKYCREGIDLAL